MTEEIEATLSALSRWNSPNSPRSDAQYRQSRRLPIVKRRPKVKARRCNGVWLVNKCWQCENPRSVR